VEMEAATVFALARRLQIPAACVLVVTDTFAADGTRTRIGEQALPAAAERMGRAATAALAGFGADG
jgi:uridine phosphorylase